MTPEQALAKLENKIEVKTYRREPLKNTLPLKEARVPNDIPPIHVNKTNDFMRVFIIVLISAVLIILYLWKFDAVSKNSYSNGFNDGVASISPNLISAQKDIDDKFQQLNQMHQDLDAMTRQKDQLAQNLKEAQEALPSRIGALDQRWEGKIKRLTEESQSRINGLNEQLNSAQRDTSDKKQQLAAAQKDLAKIEQDLKSVIRQKDQLAQSLKAAQKPVVQTAISSGH